MDENDPLWQLVLTKICNGDRDRATKLINNPDSLTKYPEVVALIEIMPSAAMEEEEDGEKEGRRKMKKTKKKKLKNKKK